MGVFIEKLKKKIQDSVSSAGNRVSTSIGLNDNKPFIQSPTGQAISNFNRNASQLYTNKVLQPIANTPRFEFAKKPIENKVLNFGRNVALGIPESFINIPRNLAVGAARLEIEKNKALMERQRPSLRNIASGIAPIAEAGLDFASFGVGSNIAKQGGKILLRSGMKQAVKQGAISGAKYGGAGGLTYGIDRQYGQKFSPGQLAGDVASGALLGGVLGGGVAGSGAFFQQVMKNVKKINPKLSPRQVQEISAAYLRDKAGRFAKQAVGYKGVMPDKVPYEPIPLTQVSANKLVPSQHAGLYKNLDKNLNIPEDFDIKRIKLGAGVKEITPETRAKLRAEQSGLSITPKGNLNIQQVGGQKTSRQLLEQPLEGGIPTRTTANSAVSSTPSIEKGQLNINRLNVKGAGKKVLQSQEAQVQPTVIGNKEVVDMARTAKGTSTLTDDQMTKLMAQQLKNRQVVVDLTKRYNEAKKSGATDMELGRIMLDMANQSRTARQGGTFAGRLLQSQNIIADQSASPMQKILALLDNAGVGEEKYLKDAVKVNWDNPADVVSFYRKYVPPKFGEVLDEIRYSNMLSSPLTHIVNVSSNALQTGVVAPIEKTITGTLDFGKSLLTGSERKYYATAGIDYAGGYIKALPTAIKKAWNVMSGKEITMRPDFEYIPTGSTGAMKAYC